jgi:hypothetical protein
MARRIITKFNVAVTARLVKGDTITMKVGIADGVESTAFTVPGVDPVGYDLGEEQNGVLTIIYSKNGLTDPFIVYESKDSGHTWTLRV